MSKVRSCPHAEKKMAARELVRIGYPLRMVTRMTGLSYITVYRIANPGLAH